MKNLVLPLLLVAGAGVAHAQPSKSPPAPPPTQVEKLEASGGNHYTLAEYDLAIADFKEAFRLSPNPGYLYNIAQSYRMKKDCRESATFYKNYLREATAQNNGKEPANAPRVRSFITDMEKCAETQPPPVTTPPVTTPPTTTPPPTTPETPETPETPPPAAGKPAWMRWVGIGGIVVGAAGEGMAVKFILDGKTYNDQLKTKCATSCTSAEALAIQSDGKAANRNAVIFGVAGGVVLAGGAALLVMSFMGGGHQAAEEPEVSFQLTRGGATASYGWRF